MSTHLTRKELKQDNVALKVEETFDFFNIHKHQFFRYGLAAAVVIVLAAGIYYYMNSQKEAREALLGDAISKQSAPVGASPTGGLSFPTEAAKKDAVMKAYAKIVAEQNGSAEAYVAEYTLGSMDLENGKMAEARQKYQDVADHADANYASLAKLALAQMDFAENKVAEGQTRLKDLQEHPTDLVSKTQATFALAKGIAPTQPEEARKLLTGLASAQSDVSQIAVTALQELPAR